MLALAIAVLVTALGPRGSTETLSADSTTGTRTDTATADPDGSGSSAITSGSTGNDSGGGPVDGGGEQSPPEVFVHIIGAVNNPGLYQLHDGDRAVDAVAAAGGLAADADQAQLNLARFVSDGEQIIVPRVGEVPPPAATGGGTAGGTGGGSININTADAAALEDLPGVGPALAERIVQWRDSNGSFTAVEDLLNVTGIGQKKLDGMRESIAL